MCACVCADLYRWKRTLRSSVGIFSHPQKTLSVIAVRQWMVSDTYSCNSMCDSIDQWSTCPHHRPSFVFSDFVSLLILTLVNRIELLMSVINLDCRP